MHISWRSSLGETGIVTSPMITRTVPASREVEFEILNLPKTLRLGESHKVSIRVMNKSSKYIKCLRLDCRQDVMQGVKVHGLSSKVILTILAVAHA